jgi:V8-like Glu-specific endopeptidase
MKKLSISLTLFLMLSLVFVFSGNVNAAKSPPEMPIVRQAFMERSPGSFDPAEYVRNQQRLFDWLMAEAVPLTPESIIVIDVTDREIEELEKNTCETCGDIMSETQRVRIGLVKHVRAEMTPGSLTGTTRLTADGGFVRTMAVESRNATALRVHFSHLSLPENAALYLYNMNGEAFGPYTGQGPGNSGDFWSHTVSGPVAYIQLRHFGPADNLNSTNFTIDDVGYIGQKFLLPFLQKSPEDREEINRTLELCSYNEPCIEDASCYSGTAINDAKDAVAYIQWISGAWIYSCTGGLLADTDTGTQIPYFLTANHCISKSKTAAAIECYFQYWTANCGGACYNPVGAVPRTLGADLVKTNSTGDYSLLKLRENPPAGSAFLGWSTADVANANGTALYRISHPSGAPQAYSRHQVDTSSIVCSGWPRGSWIYSKDVVGATEGGSSGSPVLNASGQVVGQLSGACGYNVYEACDSESNWTVDGAFASYYTEVMPWLDPGTTPTGDNMHVQSIDFNVKKAGINYTIKAEVTIVDEGGSPVEGATVTGTFSGDVSGTTSAVTGADGVATLTITMKGTVTAFTFCVDNVTHSSYTYDSGANVETCDTY